MNWVRWLAAVCVVPTASALAAAQALKAGPEHEILQKLVGKWEGTVQGGGQESKGTMRYHTIMDGRWLESSFRGETGGQKVEGKGLDGYNANKKKYVSVWIDSMSQEPLIMEGTYDADTKTMTMTGDGPGMDGKPAKLKQVTIWKDDDTMVTKMYQVQDGKDNEVITIAFKRVK